MSGEYWPHTFFTISFIIPMDQWKINLQSCFSQFLQWTKVNKKWINSDQKSEKRWASKCKLAFRYAKAKMRISIGFWRVNPSISPDYLVSLPFWSDIFNSQWRLLCILGNYPTTAKCQISVCLQTCWAEQCCSNNRLGCKWSLSLSS